MNLISPEYQSVLVETHKNLGRTWGGGHSVDKFIHYKDTLKSLDVKTILDYGCANGKFKVFMDSQDLPYEVFEYDPGVPGKDVLPKPADFVVCCDVMEHVEPELLDSVMQHLKSLVIKGGFFNISTVKAHTILSDGTNAHKIVENGDWWVDKFSEYFDLEGVRIAGVGTTFTVYPKKG
jgi:2-polyprenyl-3-methyl-5-hydroxy-6-metoxy-1,4-benzoquinol methylase